MSVIPNGLDIDVFQPQNDQLAARQAWGLPQTAKIILYGGHNPLTDRRKGFVLLQSALDILKQSSNHNLHLVIFGAVPEGVPPQTHIPTKYIPWVKEEKQLSFLYHSADVMIMPSLQEGFGQTASEAMACGTPVVTFADTGITDIVDHKVNGYLARHADPADLAEGISWVLAANQADRPLSREARKKAENNFDIRQVCQKYLRIYNEILF